MEMAKDAKDKAKKEASVGKEGVHKALDESNRVKSDHGPYKETTTLQRETNEQHHQYASPGAHAIAGPGFSAVSLGSLESDHVEDMEQGRPGPPPPALILTATLVEDSPRPVTPPFLPTVLASPPVLAHAEPAEHFETEFSSQPDSLKSPASPLSPKRIMARSRRTKCILCLFICVALSIIAGLSVGLSLALRKKYPPKKSPPKQDNGDNNNEDGGTEVNSLDSTETGSSETSGDSGGSGGGGRPPPPPEDGGGGGGGNRNDDRKLQKYRSIRAVSVVSAS